MPDYKKMYFALFNAVTTAIDILQRAQQQGESAFVEGGDVLLTVLSNQRTEETEKSDVIRHVLFSNDQD